MPPFSPLPALLSSLLSGSLSSLVGLGGGFVLTPVLTSSLVVRGGLRQRRAQATVLASIAVGAAGAAGSYLHAKSGPAPAGPLSGSPRSILSDPACAQILLDASLVSVAGLLLSPVGAAAARRFSDRSLRRLMGGVMIAVGPTVPLRGRLEAMFEKEGEGRAPPAKARFPPPLTLESLTSPAIYQPLLIGLSAGFLSGLLGVGGGALTVPLISLHHSATPGYRHTDALATSLLAMPLPALVATAAQRELVHGPLAAVLAAGAVLGGAATARVVEGVGEEERGRVEEVLRWGFAGLMLVLGGRFVRR